MSIEKESIIRKFIKKLNKGVVRHLTRCPKCGKKFYNHNYAAEHAKIYHHYGDYNITK